MTRCRRAWEGSRSHPSAVTWGRGTAHSCVCLCGRPEASQTEVHRDPECTLSLFRYCQASGNPPEGGGASHAGLQRPRRCLLGVGAPALAGGTETCLVLGGLPLPARSEEARPRASGVQDAEHSGEMGGLTARCGSCLLIFWSVTLLFTNVSRSEF